MRFSPLFLLLPLMRDRVVLAPFALKSMSAKGVKCGTAKTNVLYLESARCNGRFAGSLRRLRPFRTYSR
jgi:hypothetical protein